MPPEVIPPPLRRTLEMVADLASSASDPWWVISSAAVALHGVPLDNVRDVDLLMSSRDARLMLMLVGSEPVVGTGTSLFRSAVFGKWTAPPLEVEIFGGFEFAGPNGWTCVKPTTRQAAVVGDKLVFIPHAAELQQMLIGFGRPKDRQRALQLERRTA